MNNHLVSIIMPVRNGSNYIEEALSAIKSQDIDMEIIAVDDGSNDDTAQIAESFGCIVVKHPTSKGPVIAKNTALKIARGRYVMFHDHDDLLTFNALPQMLKELQENEGIFAVMAQMQDFFSPELSEDERKKIALRTESYSGLLSGAILMKKEVFDKIGLFDAAIKTGEIIQWQDQMNKNNLAIKKLNFVATNKRVHSTNLGRIDKESKSKDYAALLRAKIKC